MVRDHKTIVSKMDPSAAGRGRPSRMSFGILRRVRRATTGTLALVGFGAVVALAYEYSQLEEPVLLGGGDDKKEKKQVLVLPFHRMKLVETRSGNNPLNMIPSNDEDRILEVRTVIEMIKLNLVLDHVHYYSHSSILFFFVD